MDSKERVYLTPLEDEHISRYMQLSDDLGAVAGMGWRPFGAEEKERFRDTMQVLTLPYSVNSKPNMFSIISAKEGRPVGFVCLKGISEDNSSAEVGIAIMEREYRNRGYGTEALKLASQYAFNELRLDLLGLTVLSSNHRAIRTYEKVGFRKKEFLKRSWEMPSGEYVDMWLMELTRDQWMGRE